MLYTASGVSTKDNDTYTLVTFFAPDMEDEEIREVLRKKFKMNVKRYRKDEVTVTH